MPAVICEVKELLQDVFDGTPLVAGPRPHKSLQGLEVGNQRTLCVVVAALEPAVNSVLDCGQMGRGLLVVADVELDVLHTRDLLRRARSSVEHTSELQSLMRISYAVFCLTKKINQQHITMPTTNETL